MKRYRRSELLGFLRSVDRNLHEPFELVVIGGGAVLLGFGIDRVTTDIDTLDGRFMSISGALEAARKETGLQVPISHPGVEDYPYDMEDRLLTVQISGLRRLVVKVPEKHDLVLMKAVRGEETDYAAAEGIHSVHGLDKAILVQRYRHEMSHVHGPPSRMRLNFLGLIDRLYGEDAAIELERHLPAIPQEVPREDG